MFRKLFVMTLIAVVAVPSVSQAKFFGLMREDDVKKYLLDNPEIVMEALQNYQVKQEEQRKAGVREKLSSHRAELEKDPTTPVLGNPKGDVTVVEFFDYNCGFCKMMFPKVWEAVKADGNIRWVLKDLPTLSQESRTAALAGLAAQKQGKYFEMHQALMLHKGQLTDEEITKLAKEIGLNMKRFESDMNSEALQQILNANRSLANEFEIQGIPQFIIGDYISDGAMMGDELETNVQKVRSQKK